jgi:TatD DNase family protein
VSDQASPELFAALGKLTAHPQFVAIGEVGLDYAKCPIPKDQQARAFISAIELALEVKKPLVIHCREAYADLHPILEPYFGCRQDKSISPGVVHCFSGSAADAARLTNMGFYLGVDGPVTYPNAKALREALASVPAEKLVLETDSPYLPPQTSRGQRNEPGYLPGIAVRLAELKGESPESFAAISSRNAEKLFRLPAA